MIKFYDPKGERHSEAIMEDALVEEKNWKMINVKDNAKWSFCGLKFLGPEKVPCLLMPYLRGVPISERAALMEGEQHSKLWKALTSFAEKGYSHDDLNWLHVGTYMMDGQNERKIGFTDLARVSKFLSTEDREKWVKSAFKLLYDWSDITKISNVLE